MTDLAGGPPLRGTRSARYGHPGRSRVPEIVVAAVVAVGAIAYAAAHGSAPATQDASGDPRPGREGPAALAALTITGAAVPFVAVVGAGGSGLPAVVVLPPSLSFTAPGQGEATASDVAVFPGDSMRVAVSNAVGAWAKHYGSLDLDGLGQLVDRAGGITIELVEPAVAGSKVLGPGQVQLDGPGAVSFLFEADRADTTKRFVLVVRALLQSPPRLTAGDLLASDDPAGLGRLLRAAQGADVTVPPTQRVAGTVTVPDQPDFDRYLRERFGIPPPIRAIVQNGSGEPAIGEAVARQLIPEGFRIVLSGNADSFDHRVTDVLAEGPQHVVVARLAKRALGVGRVRLSQVPSGIADITIVVGKDFNG